LVLRLLAHRFGTVSPTTEAQISGLLLSQVENLGEALLDFSGLEDLEVWLRSQPVAGSELHNVSSGES
jgi:hypothetical protein